MADHIQRTIEDLQVKLKAVESEAIALKRTINSLAVLAGLPVIYSDTDTQSQPPLANLRSDQFYGKSTFVAIKEYLELRKHRGPASVNEIYQALTAGGFKFDAKDEDNAKRGIRISLTKNTGVFHRLPNGLFGLLEWYPNAKPPKKTGDDDDGVADEAEVSKEETKP